MASTGTSDHLGCGLPAYLRVRLVLQDLLACVQGLTFFIRPILLHVNHRARIDFRGYRLIWSLRCSEIRLVTLETVDAYVA